MIINHVTPYLEIFHHVALQCIYHLYILLQFNDISAIYKGKRRSPSEALVSVFSRMLMVLSGRLGKRGFSLDGGQIRGILTC